MQEFLILAYIMLITYQGSQFGFDSQEAGVLRKQKEVCHGQRDENEQLRNRP